MIYSIYLITCLVNQKVYIGFTSLQNPEDRWNRHLRSAKNNCPYLLHRAIRKHGVDNFTFQVIYQSMDGEHTHKYMEQYFIDFYKCFKPNGYNMTKGGFGSLGRVHSEETKQKIGQKSKLRKDSEVTKRIKAEYLKKNNPFKNKFGKENSNSNSYLIVYNDNSEKEIIGLQHFAKSNNYNRRSLYKLLNGEIKYHKDIISIVKIV